MSSQVSSNLSHQGLYSVTDKCQIKQKKIIARTFTVFATLVLIYILAIGTVILCSSVLCVIGRALLCLLFLCLHHFCLLFVEHVLLIILFDIGRVPLCLWSLFDIIRVLLCLSFLLAIGSVLKMSSSLP